jgi:glycosyltransferase involved in cell wall biosynthesis
MLYAGVIANMIKRHCGIPFIVTEHSGAYWYGLVRKWQVHLVKEVLRNADSLLAVSPDLGNILERQFGHTMQPWQWAPNILDKTFEDPDAFELSNRPDNDQIRILTIGNLIHGKNIDVILKAFAAVFKGRHDVQLRIGGSGPLQQKLAHLAVQLGIIGQVVFLGQLSREQVLRELQQCYFFVLASPHETFGVVLIEALAVGRPVIATDSGGPRCIVHEGNGLLFCPGDVSALANALQKMVQEIDRYDDISIREDCINRFGEKTVVSCLIEIYRRVLSSQPLGVS